MGLNKRFQKTKCQDFKNSLSRVAVVLKESFGHLLMHF